MRKSLSVLGFWCFKGSEFTTHVWHKLWVQTDLEAWLWKSFASIVSGEIPARLLRVITSKDTHRPLSSSFLWFIFRIL